MKKNDITELRTKSILELEKMLLETQKEEARSNLDLAMMRQTNRHVAKIVRRKSAILQTIMREKAITGSK